MDNSIEGALWIKCEELLGAESLILYVCLLPPERSSRVVNAQDDVYDELLQQLYIYQDSSPLIICGDLNGRFGCKQDYIEGVDNITARKFLDTKCNPHGDCSFTGIFAVSKLLCYESAKY